MDSIKNIVQSSVKVPKFDKHLKKARGHIGQNVVEITIKIKTIVWKPLMIKIVLLLYKYLKYPILQFLLCQLSNLKYAGILQ